MAEEKKNKGGRPEKQLDWDLINGLAEIHCTPKEIVAFVNKHYAENTHYNTYDGQTRRKYGLSFGEYVNTMHEATAKPKLRRLQWKGAESGNAALLIWLGKQYLGQTDKQEIEQHNYDMPTVIIDDIDADAEEVEETIEIVAEEEQE